MEANLNKLTSRSLPDLTCPHHDLHHHHLQDSQDSSCSPSSVKKDHQQQQQQQQQPHYLRDNHKLSALLYGSHFRPFFHSSSSSLSSESCHSHSLPHNNTLILHQEASSKPPGEDDFESIKLISNGAYGAVYLVRHKETNQRFAMKKINKLNLVLRNQVEQVFAERDIMSFTDNPFVVSMFCSFETKRHLCMVMEYVEGGDCAILLKNMGPLPVDLARFYFAETLLAVEYLHSFGIVHRDLKPDNLLITAMGHIKLTDFGLSKIGLMNLATNLYEGYLEARQFNDKQVFGTPEYIAPEVILRQGYGKPVDWWSMGIILYEFLVGCVPFFGETPEELFAHVINDEPEWPDEEEWPVPEETKSLITALLMRNPLDRLGTGGASEVKAHPFFADINWEDLLRQKAEFIPHLEGEDDTSYFDTRSERYNHELGEDIESLEELTDDSGSLFSSFSSCSPRYHKAYSRIEKELAEERLLKSSSASSIAMEPHPNTKSLPRLAERVHQKASTPTSSSMDVLLQRTRSLTVANPMDASKELDNSSNNNEDEKQDHQMSLSSSCASSVSVCRDSVRKISTEEGSDSGRKSNTQSSTPEMSQNESETDASPKIERRKRGLSLRSNLPRFSICIDKDFMATAVAANAAAAVSTPCTPSIREIPPTDDDLTVTDDDNLSPVITKSSQKQQYSNPQNSCTHPTSPTIPIPGLTHSSHRSSRSVIKSASVTGLSLIIPPPEEISSMNLTVTGKTGASASSGTPGSKVTGTGSRSITSPGNSSTSSRDTSPNRDITNCLTAQLKPPIIIRRGPRGFGFTLRAIRVYFGDTDVYTLHHLVMHVENNSPAFEAGLRPGDLVTHINGEPIQGLLHPQVLQLVLSGGDKINIRSTPLENTTIKTGGRKRNHKTSKLIRRQISKHRRTPPIRRTDSDKRKSRSGNLFRRLSSKRASAEIQQLMMNPISPIAMSPSRSFQSLAQVTPGCSSQSSSPGSSVPNSPALVNSPNFQPRPSSLYGLKNKLVKTCRHHQTSMQSPRRKSCGHIPLSPLARTPSPSVHLTTGQAANAATSPTRSPSPLAFPPGHSTPSNHPTTNTAGSAGGRKKVLHQLASKSYQ